jgi:Hexokinase
MSMIEAIVPTPHQLYNTKQNLTNSIKSTLRNQPIDGLSYLAYNPNLQQKNISNFKKLFVVIGGSTIETASYDPLADTLSHYSKFSTPQLTATSDLLKLLLPLTQNHSEILMIFTFPLQPIQLEYRLDGILLRGTKQHSLHDLVGKPVGKTITQLLPHHPNITILNDITALLYSNPNHSYTIAGVIGTGCNFGITHPVTRQIINLELGNFNNFELNECLISIDKQSNNPNSQLWEKSISGAYLYLHYNYWATNLGLKIISSTTELSKIAKENINESGKLARAILRLSAARVAVTIAVLCDIQATNTMLIEGSVFWNATNYQNYVNEYLQILERPHITIDNAPSAMQNLINFTTYSNT